MVEDIVDALEKAAELLAKGALTFLEADPLKPVLCTALALRANGTSIIIGIQNPADRITALRKVARAIQDFVGFALMYDGYLSNECVQCQGEGCAKCKNGLVKPKIDSIVTVVRTWDGRGSVKSYAYRVNQGVMERVLDRDENFTTVPGGPTLDSYDTVFADPRVN